MPSTQRGGLLPWKQTSCGSSMQRQFLAFYSFYESNRNDEHESRKRRSQDEDLIQARSSGWIQRKSTGETGLAASRTEAFGLSQCSDEGLLLFEKNVTWNRLRSRTCNNINSSFIYFLSCTVQLMSLVLFWPRSVAHFLF